MHQNSQLLFEKYAKQYFQPGMRVLEVGPSELPSIYQLVIDDTSLIWDTLDICENPQLTYSQAPEYEFPIADSTYNIILSGQVFEHVKKIWLWIKELSRICKVDGHVITINPASWPYHEAPVDCWRAFPEGMKALYEEANLKVLLSRCESIEGERFCRTIPGRGLDCKARRRKRKINYFLGLFGFPVECSYDTITIGQKYDIMEE